MIVTGTRRYCRDFDKGGMEIPCKMIFKGPLIELQKIKKFFLATFKIEVDIVPGSDTSLSSFSVSVSDSTSSTEKRVLDANSSECSLPKCLKCEHSATVSSSNEIASSLPSVETSPSAENHTEGSVTELVECITISDFESSSIAVKSTRVWVRFRRTSLSMEDKHIIEIGSKLTDKHINFANSLISHQFPNIGGLRSTLLQNRYYCFSLHSVQPIFCKEREHWIVASNANDHNM